MAEAYERWLRAPRGSRSRRFPYGSVNVMLTAGFRPSPVTVSQPLEVLIAVDLPVQAGVVCEPDRYYRQKVE